MTRESASGAVLLHTGRSRDEDVPQPGDRSTSLPYPPKRGGPCIAGKTAGAPWPRPADSSRNILNKPIVSAIRDRGGVRRTPPRPADNKNTKLINYKNHQKTQQLPPFSPLFLLYKQCNEIHRRQIL